MKRIPKLAQGGVVKDGAFLKGDSEDEVLLSAASPVALNVRAPMARSSRLRDVKIGENTTVTIDLDEVAARMRADFYKGAGLSITVGDV